jgi:hypothetical protein
MGHGIPGGRPDGAAHAALIAVLLVLGWIGSGPESRQAEAARALLMTAQDEQCDVVVGAAWQ